MNWEIRNKPSRALEYILFHKHDPIYIGVSEDLGHCPLCEEKIPNHFLLQIQLLGETQPVDSNYIDFFIDLDIQDRVGNNFGYYVTFKSIFRLGKDIQKYKEEIIAIFEKYEFKYISNIEDKWGLFLP